MNDNVTVSPQIGHYVVTTSDRWGVQTHQVYKDKRCTCGGRAEEPCRHIRAVASYLKAGGERAPEKSPLIRARDNGPLPGAPVPATCPICGAPVTSESRGRWTCPDSSSHYFQWRGEQGVRQFLCQPHPNKMSTFHQMTQEERGDFLETVSRRMHVGGYSPFN